MRTQEIELRGDSCLLKRLIPFQVTGDAAHLLEQILVFEQSDDIFTDVEQFDIANVDELFEDSLFLQPSVVSLLGTCSVLISKERLQQ